MKISELQKKIKKYEELCILRGELEYLEHQYRCWGDSHLSSLTFTDCLGREFSIPENVNVRIYGHIKADIHKALCDVQEEISSLDVDIVTED